MQAKPLVSNFRARIYQCIDLVKAEVLEAASLIADCALKVYTEYCLKLNNS